MSASPTPDKIQIAFKDNVLGFAPSAPFMSESTTKKLPEPMYGQSQIAEARAQQRLIDAKIALAEEGLKQLRRDRQAVEDSLWMQVSKADLTALLKGGSHGKSFDVLSDLDTYRHSSWATIGDDGELRIGGYHNNDHFRKDTLYIRKDFGRYS